LSGILARLTSVARGEAAADTVLLNANVINVFNGKIGRADVALADGYIAGVGDYKDGKDVIDLEGKYLAPGLINGHVHIESSMLDVGQYARAVVPRGTTTLVTDLHEIANVCGMEGIRYVLDFARRLPFDLFLMAPSCVPATHLETSGATIGVEDIRKLLQLRNCIGLGEMMNFPGVINGFEDVLEKIKAARGKVIDGHAPGVTGKDLDAYIAAGIYSDHESVTLEEATEKLSKGMWVMIREGSSEKNLEALLPLVTDETYKRCMFVVDDRSCVDLLHDGDIDAVVRKAISCGLDPVRAIQMATVNTAEYFRLNRHGGIAPGYLANMFVTGDLESLPVDMVFYRGKVVGKDHKPLFTIRESSGNTLTGTVNIKPFDMEKLRVRATSETVPVIEIVPGQIITKKRLEKVKTKDGYTVPDIEQDILKLVVVERHRNTGNVGLGYIHGFGLKKGAMASSIAHDSHNIVAVGTSDEDIYEAVKEIEKLQGGLVVVADGKVVESLALPIAGLLSPQPLEQVVDKLSRVERAAAELGTTLNSPFSTLSFVALPVIPEMRLTDLGLVDVTTFSIIN